MYAGLHTLDAARRLGAGTRLAKSQLRGAAARSFASSPSAGDPAVATTAREAASSPGRYDGRAGVRDRAAALQHAQRDSVWFVTAESRVAALAGAIFSCTAAPSDGHTATLPALEAMGPAAISRAVNALALCNRFVERNPGRPWVTFVPSFRIFLHEMPSKGGEALPGQADDSEIRCSVRLRLEMEPREAEHVSFGRDTAGVDVIRVASKTDHKRLSGLVTTRWDRQLHGEDPVVMQAMGARCIETMVRTLAMAWQTSAREAEVGEDCFRCLVSHLALEDQGGDGGPDRPQRFSGVECWLVAPPRN